MHIGVDSIVFIASTKITKSKLSNECGNFVKETVFVIPLFRTLNAIIYNRFYG